MKAAVWNERGSLEMVERPLPDPVPGWVRVKVTSAGICGSDLHFYRGAFRATPGMTPGHEIGGLIDTVGDGVDLPLQTAVAVEPQAVCGVCGECRSGNHNRCRKRIFLGIDGPGGCADYVTAPAYAVFPLHDDTPLAAAALAEPLAVCVRGLHRGRVEAGDRIAILGGGTIGLVSLLLTRDAGASEVFITARHAHQQRTAEELGADAVFADSPAMAKYLRDKPVDCVIETVGGHATTLLDAVRMVRPGGTVVMLGVFEGDSPIAALHVFAKEVTLVGSNCYARNRGRSDFDRAVELLHRYHDRLAPLVTHRFELDRINDAFATAADKHRGSIKVHIAVS